MTPARTNPISRLFYRVLPDTLGGRLVVTVVLLTLTTAFITVAIDTALSPGGVTDTATILSGLAAVMTGIVLGLLLTRLIGRPVARMIGHIRDHGRLPDDDLPYVEEGIAEDRTLPLEFRELGGVVEDLVSGIRQRQSELSQAARVAMSAEETLAAVVNESSELKIVLDADSVVIANPAAALALARPQTALVARTSAEAFADIAIHTDDGTPIALAGLLERALERPTMVSLAGADQPERWYIFSAVRRQDDDHDRTLISARDVTEERRLQSIRAEIVSLVSHDLRSPLAVVIGYLDLLRQPLSVEDRDRAIDSAKRNAGRMADLLEDLLSATRAEELLAASALVPVAVGTLASEVVESLAPMHAERQILFEPECEPIVLGEEKRLRQVLVNLVTNAFKYAPDTTPIHVRLTCDGGRTSIMVADHGPGIPEADRARVFERFARLENGKSRPGMGLGLYIVRIISENHGGSARVEETPGGGATFVVDLPLAGLMVDGRIVAVDDSAAGAADGTADAQA